MEHKSYIEELQVGDLIAFKLNINDAKMYSGKVSRLGAKKLEVQTKNGKKFFIEKDCVVWVNTNQRWPRFVMNGFKGLDDDVRSEQIEMNFMKELEKHENGTETGDSSNWE